MFDESCWEAVVKFDSFSNWFLPVTRNTFQVIDSTTFNNCGVIIHLYEDSIEPKISYEASDSDTINMTTILDDWAKYITRPEYLMLHPTTDDSIDDYEISLAGSVLVREARSGRVPDNVWRRISRCLTWLRSTDFYTCPASTQYHDSYSAGLLNHSLCVSARVLELLESSAFSAAVNVEDAIFAALVHDWCKIGLYTPYNRNVKDDKTGKWYQEQAYKYVDDRAICLGHGASSLYLVMKFFNISTEIAAAIRWHMGRWNCVEAEINELQQANRNYPLVHLIQFADQLAIVNY